MKFLNKLNLFVRKHKSVLVFCIFFFMIAFILPQTSSASVESSWQYQESAGSTEVQQNIAEATNNDDGSSLKKASTSWIINTLSWLVYYTLILPNGYLSGILIGILIQITTLPLQFSTLPAIESAWEVVLNLTNLLFIIILLVIAFATMFKMEAYSYKKLLPTLIIVAILVNFSKVICGLMIDASQIVMITFSDAIAGTAQQNLTVLFQIDRIFQFDSSILPDVFKDTDPQPMYLVSVLVAGAMMSIMLIVLFVYLVVFLGRIVIFWIATVLSPIAFVCAILPATKKYFQQWLETFSRYLIVGPLAMFFLWLALYIVSSTATVGGITEAMTSAVNEASMTETVQNPTISKALDPNTIASFVIAVLLLMKGMELAQQMASEFGEYVGKAKGVGEWFAKGGLGREVMKRFGKPAWKGVKAGVGYAAGSAADKIYEQSGVDLNLKRVYEKMKSEAAAIRGERELAGRTNARKFAESGSMLGWLGASDYMYRQYLPLLGEQGAMAQISNWRKGSGAFEKGYHNYEDVNDKFNAIEKEMYEEREKFNKQNITREEIADIDLEIKNLDKVDAQVVGGTVDLNDDTSNNMMTQFLGQLQQEGKSDQASEVLNLLNGATTWASASPEIKAGFNKMLIDEKADLENKKNGTIHDDDMARENAWKATMKGSDLQTRYDTAKSDLARAKEQLGDIAPVIDYAGIQAQRSYMAEEVKKIATDSENELKAALASKLKAGDQSGALAVMLQAAKVGHSNEPMDFFGLDQSQESMRLMFESFIQDDNSRAWLNRVNKKKREAGEEELSFVNVGRAGNIDRQLAMSVANDYSSAAKAMNHWNFSEMVDNRAGRFVWRSDQEQQMRQYNEMTKANIDRILQQGNRLALGSPSKDGKWQFSEAGLSAVGSALGRGMTDALRKNRVNQNWVSHMMSNPEEVKKLRQVMEEEARKRPQEAAQIRDSFRRLTRYVGRTGTQGFDPNAVVLSRSKITGRNL